MTDAPMESRATWAIRALALCAGLALLGVVSAVFQWMLLQSAAAGTLTTAAAESNDARELLIQRVQLAGYLLCAILFLRWMHRAYRRMMLLPGRSADTTPGWAVGYWFVPLLNLIRPYQIMQELWRKSQPAERPEPVPPAMSGWWGCYVVSLLLTRVNYQLQTTATTLPELIRVTWIGAVINLLIVIAGVLLIGLIRAIERAQRATEASEAVPG